MAKTAKRLEEGHRHRVAARSISCSGPARQREAAASPNSVIVLDEAGMVGTQHMARLVEHVAKVPGSGSSLVGDAKQLQPSRPVGPFKYLAEAYGRGEARRYSPPGGEMGPRRREGFRGGQVPRGDSSLYRQRAFSSRRESAPGDGPAHRAVEEGRGNQNPEKVFMLAPLNFEVKELNLRAQAERIKAGEVDPDKKIHANGVFFHVGDRLVFRQNAEEGAWGSQRGTGTVLSVEPALEAAHRQARRGRPGNPVSLKRYSAGKSPARLRLDDPPGPGATLEHVHVLMGGPLTDKHMGYVQAESVQLSTHLFTDKHTAGEKLKDLIRGPGPERQKTMAQEVIDRTPSPTSGQHRSRSRPRGGSPSEGTPSAFSPPVAATPHPKHPKKEGSEIHQGAESMTSTEQGGVFKSRWRSP